MADTFFIECLNTLPEQVQLNKEDIKKLNNSSTTQSEQIQALTTKVDTNTSNIATNTENIDSIKQSYLLKSDASDTYLSKTEASNTYATKTGLSNANKRIDALDTGTLDIDLTTSGLAKLQANPTIGTSISLTKDSDFSEYIDGVNTYKTILFSIYTDQNEDYYISADIKLDVGYTADLYGNNDQNYTWLIGIGVIKLGNKVESANQYLCFISYSQSYITPLFITPIKKLA